MNITKLALLFLLPFSLAFAQDEADGEKKPEPAEKKKTATAEKKRPSDRGKPKSRFEELDSDGNGEVSLEEMIAYGAKRAEEEAKRRFKGADLDENGKVTEAEMRLVREHMKGRHRAGDRREKWQQRGDRDNHRGQHKGKPQRGKRGGNSDDKKGSGPKRKA